MRKTFISNLIFIIGVNLLIKPFWILGIDRAVQNQLGFENYGQYYILFNFALLLSVLLDFGIANYTTSNLAKNPELIHKQFSALLTLKLIFSLAYLILTIALAIVLGYQKNLWFLIFMLCLNQVLSYYHLFFRSNISGLQLFKTDSFFSIIDRLLMIIFCSILLFTNIAQLNILNYVFAQTLAYLFSAFFSFVFLKNKVQQIKLEFNKEILWDIYKKTAPYALLALLMTLYTRLDNILLGKLLSDGQFQDGIYAFGYRLLDAANMLAILFATLLLPIFSKMIAQKLNIVPLIETCIGVLIAPSIIFSTYCFYYKSEILTLLSPNTNSYHSTVFGYVIICFVPLCIMYVFGTLLTANESLKTLNILALIALIINLAANLILIPSHKALGAAYAAVITQSFIGISNWFFAYKILKIDFNQTLFLKLGVVFIITNILLILLKINTNSILISLSLTILLGTILIFVFKLLDINKLSLIFKSKFN